MEYGYCRISTKKQSIDRQIRNIQSAYPNAFIFQESYSGRRLDRPEWNKVYKVVKDGDTLIFDSVSRMSRNAEEGVKTYFELFDRGVRLVFLKEAYINTDTYAENLKDKQIRIAFEQAQKEVDDLRQRTKEGLVTARIEGKQLGKPKGASWETKKAKNAKKQIRELCVDFGGPLKDSACMKLVGVSRNAYYKYKRELLSEDIS